MANRNFLILEEGNWENMSYLIEKSALGKSFTSVGAAVEEIKEVSVAEWHFVMNAGNEAFSERDPIGALGYFRQAASVADRMIVAAENGGFNPDCAVRALTRSRQSLSEVYLRLGQVDNAIASLESTFFQVCSRAALAKTAQSLRQVCFNNIEFALSELVGLLQRIDAPVEKIATAYSIASEACQHAEDLT